MSDDSDRRLVRLEDSVDEVKTSVTKIHTLLESNIMERVKEHGETLYGNGSPGLKTDVDRLNQSSKTTKWVIRAVSGVVIGLVVAAFWELVIGKGG